MLICFLRSLFEIVLEVGFSVMLNFWYFGKSSLQKWRWFNSFWIWYRNSWVKITFRQTLLFWYRRPLFRLSFKVFIIAYFFSLLLFRLDLISGLVISIFELLPFIVFFVLRNVSSLNFVRNSYTINRVFANTIAKMIDSHPIGEARVCLQLANVISVIRVGIRLTMREVYNVLIKLELIFKRKRTQLFEWVSLLLLTLLTLQILNVHNFNLAALCTTVFLICYVFASSVPTLPSFSKLFCAVS